MITEQQFLEALEIVKAYQKQVNEMVDEVITKKEMPESLCDIGLSTRAFNIVATMSKAYPNYLMKDVLPCLTIGKLKNRLSCGVKTLEEIREKFSKYGIIIE